MDIKRKKILVTGGSGFLGQHLVRKLLERGAAKENIFAPPSSRFDLREKENCFEAVTGCDLVIHLAGVTGGVLFHQDNPAKTFYDNLTMGVYLMEAARLTGVKKFVTIGSATEYPERASLPLKEGDIWDGLPEELHIPYTVAKKMLLVQAQAYRKQYGFNAIHLLLTNMYGPGEKPESDLVIPMIIKRIWQAKKTGQDFIEPWGTGRPTRDFLYVEDAAEGVILALERYDKPEPVNLGSGWEISIKELANLIARLMDFKGEIRFDSSKPDGVMRRMMDTTRAEKEFGFKAVTDFEAGLKETIKYFENL